MNEADPTEAELAVEVRELGPKIDRLTVAVEAKASKLGLRVAAVALVLVVAVGGIGWVKYQQEANARCTQLHGVTDAVGGIVGFTAVPNANRSPQQQAAINDFLRTAHDLLNNARTC